MSRGYIEYSGVNFTSLETDLTKDYSPHTIIVKHYLYTTYKASLTIKEPLSLPIVMFPDPYITHSESDASSLSGTCNS